ncbi:hypothetical protein ACO1O0_004754 [Amphichorda felina]
MLFKQLLALRPYPDRDLSQFPANLKDKRILLCTESFGPVNGVSRTTLMLVNHLRQHGAQVAVVAPWNHTQHNIFTPPPLSDLSPTDKLQPEVRVAGYPLPFNPELSIVYPVRNSTIYARTFGLDAPPDLIYLASPASLGFQVMLQVRQQPKENQIPIICNFQTDLAGYCQILFPAPLSYVGVRMFNAAQSYLLRHSSIKTIFYPSKCVRRYLVSQNIQENKMELLKRGVNTELFSPTKRNEQMRQKVAPNGEIIFVTVSRIAGEKGFGFLSEVAKGLDSKGLPFKLLIVGGNRNPDVEKEVQELFEPLVKQGKVIFAGFKVGDDLAEAYACGDVFLHCSVTETFGLVVLESMSSGVPVVARDQGGPSDIIQHGDTGLLVSPDDLDGFVIKAMRLARDHGLRLRMAAAARAAACEATWDRVNNKVAWRMADTIAENEHEQGRRSQPPLPFPISVAAQQLAVPIYGWFVLNGGLRQTLARRIVDVRLLGGLGIILSCWAVTGCYMLFTECVFWFKGRKRAS